MGAPLLDWTALSDSVRLLASYPNSAQLNYQTQEAGVVGPLILVGLKCLAGLGAEERGAVGTFFGRQRPAYDDAGIEIYS